MPSTPEINAFNEQLRASPFWQGFMASRGINPARGLSDAQRRDLKQELERAGVQFPRGVEIDKAGNLNENEGFGKYAKTAGRVALTAAPFIAAPFTGGTSLALIGASAGAGNAALGGGGLKEMALGAGLGALGARGLGNVTSLSNAVLNPRALTTIAAPAVPGRAGQVLSVAAPFLPGGPRAGVRQAPKTRGPAMLQSRGPTADMINAGRNLPSVTPNRPSVDEWLPSRGPTPDVINAGRNLTSLVSPPGGGNYLPSRGPTPDVINAGRNLPSVPERPPWVHGVGDIPSRGPTDEMINAGRNLPSIMNRPPSEWVDAILEIATNGRNNDRRTDPGSPKDDGGVPDWLKTLLKGLKTYGPLAIPTYAAWRGSRDKPPAEDQMNQLLGIAQRRIEGAEPLYQALNTMAMAQLPQYVKENKG